MKKELYFLYISLSLIVAGLAISVCDEVSYLNAKRRIQSDYYIEKSKLEEDLIRGLLPENTIDSYYNQSELLENGYQYELAKVEVIHDTNLTGIVGNMVTSAGLWAFPVSLMLIAMVNKELPEKQKLVLLIGAFIFFVFIAYGLYTITFELSILTRLE